MPTASVAAALAAGFNIRRIDATTVASPSTRRARSTPSIGGRRRARRHAARPADEVDDAAGRPSPPALRRDRRVPHPVGVLPLPQRARDAPLPASPQRPRPRTRPHDDPAGLVHDEAQRDLRDAADHVARVRRHPPVRAGRSGRGLHHDDRRPRSGGWPSSPATTRSACSRTPAARANSRDCSPSAGTTARGVTSNARCA